MRSRRRSSFLGVGCGLAIPLVLGLLACDVRELQLPAPPTPPTAAERAALAQLRQDLLVELERYGPDEQRFRTWLENGEFEPLEGRIDQLFRHYLAGAISESSFRLSVNEFVGNAKWRTPQLERWVRLRPESWFAHYSRGGHHVSRGYRERGGRFAADTPEENFERMRTHFAIARAELQRALELEPRVMEIYWQFIHMEKGTRGTQACEHWMRAALEVNPLTYHTRVRYMTCLEPRWGGSWQAMREFARETATLAAQNPLLHLIGGYEFDDRAHARWNEKPISKTIELMDRALAYGPSASWYKSRESLYSKQGDRAAAIRDLSEALEFEPWCTDCLRRRAIEYRDARDLDAALRDLDRAIELKPQNAVYHRDRGWVREIRNEMSDAVSDYERSAELDADDPWVLAKLQEHGRRM